jgi:hypothetical protein
VAAPKITITCDCGESRKVAYGDRYTCACGRAWSTAGVPEADYARIRDLDRRFTRIGYVTAALFALLILFFILTHPEQLLFVAPGTMMVWFGFVRPRVRRRHWLQVQELTRSWDLHPDPGA